MKKVTIRVEDTEIQSLETRTSSTATRTSERQRASVTGLSIRGIPGPSQDMLKLGVSVGDGDALVWSDKAMTDTYGNRFYIYLDFKLLGSHMAYYQIANVH